MSSKSSSTGSQMVVGLITNHSEKGPSVTKRNDTSTFTSEKFSTPFPEGVVPVVLPFVQTFNGSDTPGLRIANVTNTGFDYRMNELVVSSGGTKGLSDGAHYAESIGYVAFNAG